jgi:Cytochrome C oxidase, cbb3-type, subunit III
VTIGFGFPRAAIFAAAWLCTAGAGGAMGQGASPDEGMRIYKSANCVGCHKWSGNGGGSYGGAAANLRQTQLSLTEIEETVRCGRPMAGMPHFQADAYSDGTCYGLKEADLSDGKMPPGTSHPLRPADIKMVAEYVATQIKGKGEPTFAQCQAFFGGETRVCDVYARQGEGARDASASSAAEVPSHRHMQVEAASDANAPSTSRK